MACPKFQSAARHALGAVVAFVCLSGATPWESGYSGIAKKREAIGTKGGLVNLRDDAVKPEEVYKNGVQEISLIATDTMYYPSRLLVRKNIPVRLYLTSASPGTLCFVLDDFIEDGKSIRKGIATQTVEQIDFLPTKAGQYRFYCPAKEIQGSLVVRD